MSYDDWLLYVSSQPLPSNDDLFRASMSQRERLDVGIYDVEGHLIGIKDDWDD